MAQVLELEGGGTLALRQEGGRVRLEARRPQDGRGLYTVRLLGPRGDGLLLGTLAPEGEELTLRRTLPLGELERAGCWPPSGARAELAFSFAGPRCWYCEGRPGRLVADPILRQALGAPMLCSREGEGFSLAAPFRTDAPVPLSPLFCLARVERVEGRPHLVWTFDGAGRPLPPARGE